MAQLDKDQVDKFLRFKEVIGDACIELLVEYNKLKKVSGFGCLDFITIDEDTIEYKGDETWSYGGYQVYTFTLPVKYLYDDSWKQILIQQHEEERLLKLREAHLKTEQDLQELQVRAEYLGYKLVKE